MKISSSTIRKLYLGTNEVYRVYAGSTIVFDTSVAFASWFVSQAPAEQPTSYQIIADQLFGSWLDTLAVQES